MSDIARFIKRVETLIGDGQVLEAHHALCKYLAKPKLPFTAFRAWTEIVAGSQCVSLQSIKDARKHAKLTSDEKAILDSYSFVDAWLRFDAPALEALLLEYHDFTLRNDGVKDVVNARIHFRLCIRTLTHRMQNLAKYTGGAGANLVFIGDSHALVPSGRIFTWRGRSVIASGMAIRGIKMFHLGKKSPPKWKAFFREKLKHLPPECEVVVSIGEIDCRPNEGIFYTAKRRNISKNDLLETTVQQFVDFASQEISKSEKNISGVTLMGVPFPAYDIERWWPGTGGRQEFQEFILSVNAAMRHHSARVGWDFLDVYSATLPDEKHSDNNIRLDEFHLAPVFYDAAENWIR